MIMTAAEFARLRSSDDPAEYHRAAHDAAPEAVWREVIATRPDLRVWVAHNKSVPLEILRELAGDPDVDVRWTVAMKRKLDAALFERMADDPDSSVRHRIACNAKAPRSVLERLASDPLELVADAARKRLSGT